MRTDSSCKKSPQDICKPEKMSKPFKDISKYFSEEEWERLTKWQKSAYVFMKRNYIRMTSLGVTVNQPVFMREKEQITESLMKESDEDHGQERVSGRQVSIWSHRLRERKTPVIYEEISDDDEEEEEEPRTISISMESKDQAMESLIKKSDEGLLHESKDDRSEGKAEGKCLKVQKWLAGDDKPKGLPGTACGSGQPWKNLLPLGKPSHCEKHSKKSSGSKKNYEGMRSHGVPESKHLLTQEEISEPEEDD
ncbi:protein SSX1-like [Acomys russatus]|uniref:protein SSX1-like n=1 Tax=Acomys russatus TaxID=60746 RepID=UPI0021E30A6B|nr:protein SSX1-like [Acomys russatus]